jgi:hypothetical protein
MSIVNIVMGDSSGDGHDKTETFTLSINRTPDELNDAYNRGLELGMPSIVGQCEDYQDHALTERFVEAFIAAVDAHPEAFTTTDREILREKLEDAQEWCMPEDFMLFYLAVCKVGYPDLMWTVVSDTTNIFIGGYGLFE